MYVTTGLYLPYACIPHQNSLGYYRGENAIEHSDAEWHDLWDVHGVKTIFPVHYIAESCDALLEPAHCILQHWVAKKCHAKDWHYKNPVSHGY